MKNILALTMFCLSPMVFAEADFCTEQKGEIEISTMGTYRFKTVGHCQIIYKKIKQCQSDNVALYEKGLPRVECDSVFQAYLNSGTTNVVKISD